MKFTFSLKAFPLFCGLVLVQARPLTGHQMSDPPSPQEIQALERKHAGNAGEAPSQGAGVEVLSDTMGIDFGPYLARAMHAIRLNWYNLVPEVARAPISKSGKVTIEFAIRKNGTVEAMTVTGSSGDFMMDRAAWGGITASSPFAPLPAQFSGQYIALRVQFVYNPKKGQPDPSERSDYHTSRVITLKLNQYLSESPRYEVRVPAGETQQFSVTVNVVGDKRVLWSVGGSGCAEADCGTVSETGLYKAPSTVPEHARIRVKATLAADPIRTVSANIVIVRNPSN